MGAPAHTKYDKIQVVLMAPTMFVSTSHRLLPKPFVGRTEYATLSQ